VKYLLILLVFFISSCSWRQRDFERDIKNSPDPVSNVEVTNRELIEKFEIKPTNPEPPPTLKTETDSKKPQASAKVKVVEKVKTKIVKTPVKKVVTTTIKKEVQTLPEDYPNELADLNTRAQKVWEQFRPVENVGDKTYLDINYLGMTIGKISIENRGKEMINNKEVWHYHSRFKSAPFYSSIYELDDTVDAYVETNQFLSMKYSLMQRESKQDIDDLQLFDRDRMKLFWFYKRVKSDKSVKNKQGESFIPYFSIDPFSTLFLLQGLPLKNNDHYEIPIINKDKIMVLKVKVEGREKIDTNIGKKKAIRIHATTQYTGETLKSGDLTFWFADDDKRTLLEAKAKIKLGSVTAEIVKP
jgi:hypothetical protein